MAGGSSGGGNRYHLSNYYFTGPFESKDSVINTVKEFYQDIDYEFIEN
jgi:hypothetical protein